VENQLIAPPFWSIEYILIDIRGVKSGFVSISLSAVHKKLNSLLSLLLKVVVSHRAIIYNLKPFKLHQPHSEERSKIALLTSFAAFSILTNPVKAVSVCVCVSKPNA